MISLKKKAIFERYFFSMKTLRFTFPKKEHLCGKTTIDKLFEKNNSFLQYPLRVLYKIEKNPDNKIPAKILLSVSKKYFKRAIHRNTLKRKMREAYRKQKSPLILLLSEKNLSNTMAILYISKEPISYEQIDAGMKECITKLMHKIENTTPK